MKGDISVIGEDLLQTLPSIEREAMAALLGRESSFILHLEEGLSSGVLRSAMIRLKIRPVPGRDGGSVYRAWVGPKLAVVVDQPEAGPMATMRVWMDPTDVNEAISDIQALVARRKDAGTTTTLLAEDHPEERAIGFVCAETDTIWLLPVEMVERDLEAKAITSPMAASLITSAHGRGALATVLAAGKLDDSAYASAREILRDDPQGKSSVNEALAASLASRYKARYMPPVKP